MNQIATSLSQNKVIDSKTADNVIRLSDYYSSANKHKNSIKQMIKTKNFDFQAANDAYQFMKTGTDNSVVAMNNTVNQSSNTAFTPQYRLPIQPLVLWVVFLIHLRGMKILQNMSP